MGSSPGARPYQRNDRPGWYVRFWHEAIPYTRKAGDTEQEAQKKLNRARDMLARGYSIEIVDEEVFDRHTGVRLTFKESAPLYLDAVAAERKASTINRNVNGLAVLCRAHWATKPLRAITRADILRWKDRRAKKVSPATINRDLALASVVLRWAIDRGFATENPFRLIRRASEKGRARTMWLTADECRSLLTATSGAFHNFIILGLHTGFRKDELFSLEWPSVDFENNRIHVEPEKSKSGKGRYVPMTDEGHTLLLEMRARRRSSCPRKFVILTRRERPLNTKALDARWRKLKKKGVKGIEPERLKKITAHVLRHTYASHLAQAGLPLPKLAQYLGHGSAYVTERYTHLSPDDDDDVGAMLSRQLKGSEDVVRDRPATVLPGLAGICTVTKTVTKSEGPPSEAA